MSEDHICEGIECLMGILDHLAEAHEPIRMLIQGREVVIFGKNEELLEEPELD